MIALLRKSLTAGMALCLLGGVSSGCGSDEDSASQGGGGSASGGAGGSTGGSAGVSGASGSAGSAGSSSTSAIVDLRADANRDGVVDLDDATEDLDEDTWTGDHGAVFLANLDDDEEACPTDSTQSDADLAACHDAADDVVNGPDDLMDMARLLTAPWPDAPEDASGTIEVSMPGRDYVRLFVRRNGEFTVLAPDAVLSAQELRAGVELALEGKDVVRDPSVWDGYVDVTLKVEGGTGAEGGLDTVRMRVAPILFSHHLQPVEALYATGIPGYADSTVFTDDLGDAATAAGVPEGLVKLQVPGFDQWTQDLFESGAMTMPGAGGEQHAIRVFVRSANVDGYGGSAKLRVGGRIVFTYFRGKDVAALQQADVNHDGEMDSLNSFGNTETIPPYSFNGESYPLGRVLRGSIPSFHPDPSMSLLIASQSVQPVLNIDTAWLYVGHVDETLSFIKADTPLGFAVIVNDPALARQMLEDAKAQGQGKKEMFTGLTWVDDYGDEVPATATINEVLADTDVMAMSAEAAVEVEAQLDLLRQEIGITEEDLIRVPYLHDEVYGYSIAYQPGTVNGVVLADTHFATPDPHGPVINGEDIFKKQMQDVFGAKGITVHFVEDWNLYHRLEGEVHCGSNAKRALQTDMRWWETGR
jgi:protein-arginine deiminase